MALHFSKNIPAEVAKYFLYKALMDGELVSPLKMQKIVYYAYVWTLVRNKETLFNDRIEAWPMGPVIPNLYHELKKFGYSPIDVSFLGFEVKDGFEDFAKQFNDKIRETLDKVYDTYMTMTAFELVAMVHTDKAWLKARKGLTKDEPSNRELEDKHILEEYGKE